MKKILISTLVGTVIFFAWQMLMWMGGFHSDFYTYTPKQDTVMQFLAQNLGEDGMYFMPAVDAKAPDAKAQEEKMMTERVGKPWAMVNYHATMDGFESSYVLLGILYSLLACLIASWVIYTGQFPSFALRFMVGFGFGLFTLMQGVLDDMNWWGLPWNFVKPEVIDLTLGWGLCAAWMGWYLKK
jgi:hypothetical protein